MNQQGCIEFIKSDSKSIILIRINPFWDLFLEFYAFIIHYSIMYNIIIHYTIHIIHYSDQKRSRKEREGAGLGMVLESGTQKCYMVLLCPQDYQCQPDFLPLTIITATIVIIVSENICIDIKTYVFQIIFGIIWIINFSNIFSPISREALSTP